ncbi:hypothetical protein SAMD00024442_134_2 [Candidatus Symbiothrix dinenymphae]|nr:hypothetical protein SAMD00024442_134_2 [Candidatus Symbiothrix dinenymphae]
MKTRINLVSAFAVILMMTACEGMMDVHKDYLEGGEKVYLSKPLSVNFRAGYGRVVAELVLYNSPNVKTVDISWNNGNGGKETQSTPVSPSTGLDTLFIPITGLEEKAYTFTLVTSDAYGNHSLPFTDAGTVYDTLFQASTVHQPISQIVLTEDGGQLSWTESLDYLLGSEIRYASGSNDTLTVFAPADVSASLPNVKIGSKVTYRSLFLPEPSAIDTFYTAWAEYETAFPATLLLDKTRFGLVGVSSESSVDNCVGAMANDNNTATYWQSYWNPVGYAGAPFPHWIIFDLNESRHVIRVILTRRSDQAATKTVQVFVGDDPAHDAVTWKLIGSVLFPNSNPPQQTLDVVPATDSQGRYLKVNYIDSHQNTYVSLAEIDVYVD